MFFCRIKKIGIPLDYFKLIIKLYCHEKTFMYDLADDSSGYELLQWRPKKPCDMVEQGIIWLSMASAAISYTVADAMIFKPLRCWVLSKNTFIGHLISCGYCLGFWVCFFLEAIFQPNLFDIKIAGHILTAFIMAWMSGAQWILMAIAMKISGK